MVNESNERQPGRVPPRPDQTGGQQLPPPPEGRRGRQERRDTRSVAKSIYKLTNQIEKDRESRELQAEAERQRAEAIHAAREQSEELIVGLDQAQEQRLIDLRNKLNSSPLDADIKQELLEDILFWNKKSEDEIRQGLLDAGLVAGEIADFIDLGKKYRETFGSDERTEQDLILGNMSPEVRKLFTIDHVKNLLIRNLQTGHYEVSYAGQRELKKAALKYLNDILKTVDGKPDTDFSQSFNLFYDEPKLKAIEKVLIRLRDDEKWSDVKEIDEESYKNIRQFLGGLVNELGRERELRELYHDVGIWIKTATPENLSKSLSRYNVSAMVSPVLSDVDGKLISIALSEYENYLQYDIAKNKGYVRSSLYSAKVEQNMYTYDNEDRRNLRERLKEKLKNLNNYAANTADFSNDDITKRDKLSLSEDIEEWQIDRALSYARGIHLIVTIRGFEIPASGRPTLGFEGSADNFYDMSGLLNPLMKWRTVRGGGGLGGKRGTDLMHVPEVLLSQVDVRPEKSLLKRLSRFWERRWNPRKIHETAQKWAEEKKIEYWEKIRNNWLYKDIEFKKLLSFFGIGGLAARGGWRLRSLKKVFEKHITQLKNAAGDIIQNGREFGKDWVKDYEDLGKKAGVGMRFGFDISRAEEFAKIELWKKIRIGGILPGDTPDEIKLKLEKIGESELNRTWLNYFEGDNSDKYVFEMPDGEKVTTAEYVEIKMHVLRGMNFYDLLKRSPLAFLNNLVSLVPEVLTEKLGGFKSFYFWDRDHLQQEFNAGNITKTEQNDAIKFQAKLNALLGIENLTHLKEIRMFYKRLEIWGKNLSDYQDTPEGEFNKEFVLTEFYRQMTLAAEKVKYQQKLEMEEEDIEDPELRELIFGNNPRRKGLVTYFKEFNDYSTFGVEDVGGSLEDAKLGENGFFFKIARGWYNELGYNLHPNTSDVDWRYIFQELGPEAGENVIVRLWRDLHSWNEVTNQLINFDHMLIKIAESHDMNPIVELHEKIHSLEGIMGPADMQKAQYYISTIVSRYFQEHYAARLPFPFNALVRIAQYNNISLSQIYGKRGAMTLKSDAIMAYIQKLRGSHDLADKGRFSWKNLARSVGTDWPKLIMTESAPNFLVILALFMLYKYISQALKETSDEKK